MQGVVCPECGAGIWRNSPPPPEIFLGGVLKDLLKLHRIDYRTRNPRFFALFFRKKVRKKAGCAICFEDFYTGLPTKPRTQSLRSFKQLGLEHDRPAEVLQNKWQGRELQSL